MFGSCLICIYHRLLELIWSYLSRALISISGGVGWEQCLSEFALFSSGAYKLWNPSEGDPSSGVGFVVDSKWGYDLSAEWRTWQNSE